MPEPRMSCVRNLEVEALNALGQFRLLMCAGVDREQLEGVLDRHVAELRWLGGENAEGVEESGGDDATVGDQAAPAVADNVCRICSAPALVPVNAQGTVLKCGLCGTVHDLV